MYCTNCGNPLPDDAVFCPVCGQKTGRQPSHGRNVMDDYGYRRANTGYAAKSRILAGVLAILLGTLGVHNFYLGYRQKGFIQLFLGLVGLGVISGIWAMAEAVMIFTGRIYLDGYGVPLKD